MHESLSSKTLDHLGLVSGMCDELSISEIIDSIIPQDTTQRNISIGLIVKALILNGLGFVQRRLYLVPSFFSDKPTELLLGQDVLPEHLNDTVIGRALDAIYDYGCTDLFSTISGNACQALGLISEFCHLDSTSFHLHGKYNSETPPAENEKILHLTKGYSRDFHPELNQLVLNLISENKAGIPLHMQALSGNSDDKTSFRETIENHIENLQNLHGVRYVVADSALYTLKNITAISDKTLWISRVPETIAECKTLIEQTSVNDMITYDDNYKFLSVCSKYGEIKQRWLIVWSSHAYTREKKTLTKQFLNSSEKEIKAFAKLTNKEFACIPDAEKALEEFQSACKYIEITDHTLVPEYRYSGKGRPKKGQQPDITVYKIQGNVSSVIENYHNRLESKGKFILATNQLDENELSDKQFLKGYKNQGKVEGGFRFIKDPQFLASTFFVQKPERLEAISFIMTLCLLVYAALEYRLRKKLEEEQQSVPNQLGKQINNPTMRWIFAMFAGIHLLYIKDTNTSTEQHNITNNQVFCLNLKPIHNKILKMLGKQYLKYYFSP